MSLRIILLFVVLHGAAAFVFLDDVGPGFPLDDAWLHMVYARSFGEGRGFAFNPGQMETGITAPVWTALLSIPVTLADVLADPPGWLASIPVLGDGGFSGRPDTGVRLLGGLVGLLTALAGFKLAARAGRWPAWFTGLALTLDSTMVFDRFAGMEVPLFGLGSLLFVAALIDEREVKAGVLAGLLALTRPEGAVLALLGTVWFAMRRHGAVKFLVMSVAVALPWMAYCFLLSERPWPATAEAKTVLVLEPRLIASSLHALVTDSGWGWALPLAGIVGVFSLEGGRHSLGVVTAVTAALLTATVLVSRPLEVTGDPPWIPYYWARYAHIVWPLVLVLGATGLSALVRTAYAGLRCRPHYAVLLIAPFLVLGWFGRDLFAHAGVVHDRFVRECRHVETLHVAAGEWIASHTDPEAVVATHDAGAIRYFGDRTVVDIFGHQNFRLLQAERSGPALARQWLASKEPDVLAVFPVLWARNHSPEFKEVWASLPPQEGGQLLAAADDYAEFFGLTKRVKTFETDDPATVPGPLHRHLAIFVAP